uniref:ubiquitinyl hydrolase 1 n=1 Tax=Romanomermis culicivorax TaxID=13658 RepID=A0A915JA73_ROMCU
MRILSSSSAQFRCRHTRAGKYKSTKTQNFPLTYEMAQKPWHIGVRKSWLTWHTSNIEGFNKRQPYTAAEDEIIRRLINGTWHQLFASELVIKRRGNLIIIAGIVERKIATAKMYFLIGYTEELLSLLLKQPVKMELQSVADKKEMIMDLNFHPIFRALRVAQLDVDDLERSIEDTALDQYKKVLESASISDTNALKPEFLAILRCLFWFYSIRTHDATLGQRMMGVFYENFSFKGKVWHFALTILMPYLRSQSEKLAAFLSNHYFLADAMVKRFLHYFDITLDILDLINYLLFLNRGNYRNLVERCLQLQVVYKQKPSIGDADFSSMSRELFWHASADLMALLIPFLQLRRYWQKIRRWRNKIRSDREATTISEETEHPNDEDKTEKSIDSEGFEIKLDNVERRKFMRILEHKIKCAICLKLPIIPCHIGCPHVFCYYCIAAHKEENASFSCPSCDHSRLFTLLIEDFGVKGVEVEEIYDLQSSIEGPVYGFILLFKWLEGGRRKRRNSKFELATGSTVTDENLVNSIFFAQQSVMNSCATHAILSILMNRDDILLGETLSQLKTFTAGMDSEVNNGSTNMPTR